MVVRDKPVSVESRLIPPHPKSNALSATYQRCCASLRVDSTFNHRFSSAESPRLDIHHSVENFRPFVQLVFSRPLSPGIRLGHYDVTALLGEGGMGQVWQATEPASALHPLLPAQLNQSISLLREGLSVLGILDHKRL